jgi:hypothetical protein
MKTPVVLMRCNLAEEYEFEEAAKHFPTFKVRSKVPPGSLVIARYSALPYYGELVEDLAHNGSELINSLSQHRWIADLGEWYEEFKDITPKAWSFLEGIPEEGPFVLKGETNSRKFDWKTHMFAQNKKEAIQVYLRLSQDSLISQQKIYVRQYVPLKTLEIAFGGELPITEEYRFFILDGEVLCGAFYWSPYLDDLVERPNVTRVPEGFIRDIASRTKGKARFVVADVAKTQDDRWILIELNDGQMSGLSENSPNALYSALANRLK